MSDLTITNAGISVTKKTGGEVLSNNKKLGQMNITTIDVDITLDSPAYAIGDNLFLPTKIENALAVKGGSGILQSVVAVASNDDVDADSTGAATGAFDLIVTSDATTTGFAAMNAAASGNDYARAVAINTCGWFSMTNMTDMGAYSIGSKNNIGMVVTAESDSRDLYVWGIAQAATDYDLDDDESAGTADGGILTLRFGIVQD
jgi:hypothetical protein